MFKGSYVAMVTPFRDGKLDEEGIRSLVEFHVENGTHGVCGVWNHWRIRHVDS